MNACTSVQKPQLLTFFFKLKYTSRSHDAYTEIPFLETFYMKNLDAKTRPEVLL